MIKKRKNYIKCKKRVNKIINKKLSKIIIKLMTGNSSFNDKKMYKNLIKFSVVIQKINNIKERKKYIIYWSK